MRNFSPIVLVLSFFFSAMVSSAETKPKKEEDAKPKKGSETKPKKEEDAKPKKGSATKPKNEDDTKIELNNYLGLLVQKLDLEKQEISVHVFNITAWDIKASFAKKIFEGRIVVKTETEVKTFVHVKYKESLLLATWLHEFKTFRKGQIVAYNCQLVDYLEMNKPTTLKKFLSDNKSTEVYIKAIGSNFMVFPSAKINTRTMSGLRALQGSWQKFKL